MRTALLCIMLTSAVAAYAAPCRAKIDHRTIDQTAIQNIQKNKVNSGKELWRLDPKLVAQHEALGLTNVMYRTITTVPVKFVRGDDKLQVFSLAEQERPGVAYEITMKKFEWLLPYSGIYKLMMWTVTDVKTVCGK